VLYSLVIGLGVWAGVMVVVGVDGSSCNLFEIRHGEKRMRDVETEVISLVGVAL
jgi:hypothetical protein